MVDRAAERVEQLHADDRELHFSREEGTNRVIIEVRDLDGNVIKTIPPVEGAGHHVRRGALRGHGRHHPDRAWPRASTPSRSSPS